MAVVLDSTQLPDIQQCEAFHDGLDALLPRNTRVVRARGSQGILRAWTLGPDSVLLALDGATQELRLSSSTRQRLRESNPETLSVAFSRTQTCVTENLGVRERARQRLRLMDLTSAYSITYHGACCTASLEIDYASTGLRVDTVRQALDSVWTSPLHGLVHRHLRDLRGTADALVGDDLAATGTATAHLVRALVQSVSGRDSERRSALADTLRARIQDYVNRHLGDPDLTPAQIATEHNISLRYLYVLSADRAETPAEWIMAQRLAAARVDLTNRDDNVSNIAQRWGFKDHSHFSRRFKAAYGLTPSEFQRTQRLDDAAQVTGQVTGASSPQARLRT